MVDFCLDCVNRMEGKHLTEADVVLREDLCGVCERLAPCVVRYWTLPEKIVWKYQHWKKDKGNQNP